jgi:hypothetical protein
MTKKLLLIHLVSDPQWYRRREKFRYLAANSLGDFDILCISHPKSIFTMIKDKNLFTSNFNSTVQHSENLYKHDLFIPEGGSVWRIFNCYDRYLRRLRNNILNIPLVKKYARKDIINYFFRPEHEEIAKTFNDVPFVFECYDDYTIDRSNGGYIAENANRELYLFRNSIVNFVTSRHLLGVKSKISSNIIYAPNGVNENHYVSSDIDELMGECRSKTIGFVGNICDHLDFDLIEEIVKGLSDYEFCFVGPVKTNNALRLNKYRNVKYIGWVPREKIPQYLHGFGVVMIPQKLNKANDAALPLKLWEYLIAGKIVLSTPTKEMLRYKNIAFIGNNSSEFINIVRNIYSFNIGHRIRKGIRLARKYTWNNITRAMVGEMISRINGATGK